LESLAKRWSWSRGKAERFINTLENEQQVVRQKTNITTLITIINFHLYQSDNNPNDNPNGNLNGHQIAKQTVRQTDTNKKNKEEKKIIYPDIFSEKRKNIFSLWINYRIEIKKPYKSQKSIPTLFKQWQNISDDEMELIINKSISNGWTGLFELNKNDKPVEIKKQNSVCQ